VDEKFNKKLTLEEILKELGLLTPEQVNIARKHATFTAIDISGALIELGFVDEITLATWLSVREGIPFFPSLKEYVNKNSKKLLSEEFARRHIIVPLFLKNKILTIAVANPYDVVALDNIIATTGYAIKMVLSTRTEIFRMIDFIYMGAELPFIDEKKTDITKPKIDSEQKTTALEIEIENPIEPNSIEKEERIGKLVIERLAREDTGVINEVNKLVERAVEMGASDIHFDPGDEKIYVRYRIDGILRDIISFPQGKKKSLLARLKLMANLDITETRHPQDGRIKISVAKRQIDLRVSTVPAINGEKIVLRILDKEKGLIKLDEMGMNPDALKIFRKAMAQNNGIILITGPTGSGKTTTLYAALKELNKTERNIMTIEDPVEYQIERINQVQVNPRIGLTFASGLRAFLRQDPDIILVGEIRDKETADIAIQAALTGHLVFSTLHTNDVPSTCKEKYIPPYELLEQFSIPAKEEIVFYKPKGCKACHGTGYKGRMPIFEIFYLNNEARRMIINRRSRTELKEFFQKSGMKTLFEDGIQRVMEGVTSLDEVLRVSHFGSE